MIPPSHDRAWSSPNLAGTRRRRFRVGVAGTPFEDGDGPRDVESGMRRADGDDQRRLRQRSRRTSVSERRSAVARRLAQPGRGPDHLVGPRRRERRRAPTISPGCRRTTINRTSASTKAKERDRDDAVNREETRRRAAADRRVGRACGCRRASRRRSRQPDPVQDTDVEPDAGRREQRDRCSGEERVLPANAPRSRKASPTSAAGARSTSTSNNA